MTLDEFQEIVHQRYCLYLHASLIISDSCPFSWLCCVTAPLPPFESDFFEEEYASTTDMLENMLQLLDADEDGKVSLADFTNECRRFVRA